MTNRYDHYDSEVSGDNMTDLTDSYEVDERHLNKNNTQFLREGYAILIQGVEVILYDAISSRKQLKHSNRILWIELDTMRLCIDSYRPSAAERSLGKEARGIYIRDISELRKGIHSYHFEKCLQKPTNINSCFTIIGSEMSFSMEFSSSLLRDWIHSRLTCIIDDSISENDREMKYTQLVRYFTTSEVLMQLFLSPTDNEKSKEFVKVLQQGLSIHYYSKNGNRNSALLKIDANINCLSIEKISKFLVVDKNFAKLNILDISEIRHGKKSFNFVRSKANISDSVAISIIGSENSIDLEFSHPSICESFISDFKQLLRIKLSQVHNKDFIL